MPRLKHFLYLLCIGVIMGMTACGDDDDDDNNDDDDDDQMTALAVAISVDPSTISEGETATVEISLDMVNQTGSPIQIDLTRPPGGTAQPGMDYSDVPANVRIEDGDQSATFTITAEEDDESEGAETVEIRINTQALPSNVAEGDVTSVTLTIDNVTGEVTDPIADPIECTGDNSTDTSRSACSVNLTETNNSNISVNGNTRTITTNNIPDHAVGDFSMGPNQIGVVDDTYEITTSPSEAANKTFLLDENTGPAYAFGVGLNGVKIDPVAAEPFENTSTGELNYGWNLEALNVKIGLDCNEAHVQPTGAYHYHGIPSEYVNELGATANAMTQIGWAADGYPIYYRYGYSEANNSSSEIIDLSSSYQLLTGNRPGDGVSEPCGEYNGRYSQDYEYVEGLGDLDECNGRTGVTPEFPSGTYYYVLSDGYPRIPRCLVGTPSDDFKIGPG